MILVYGGRNSVTGNARAKTGVLVVLGGAFRSLAACSIYGNSTGIRCWRLPSLGCQTIVEWSKRHLALTEHAGSCSLGQNREEREREREKEVPKASSVGEKSAKALHSSRSLGRVTGPFNSRTTVLITARVGLLYYLRPWIPELRVSTRFESRRSLRASGECIIYDGVELDCEWNISHRTCYNNIIREEQFPKSKNLSSGGRFHNFSADEGNILRY